MDAINWESLTFFLIVDELTPKKIEGYGKNRGKKYMITRTKDTKLQHYKTLPHSSFYHITI